MFGRVETHALFQFAGKYAFEFKRSCENAGMHCEMSYNVTSILKLGYSLVWLFYIYRDDS